MTWKFMSVEVRFLLEEEGGRRSAVGDRYRGQLRLHGDDTEFGFELRLPQPVIELGERSTGTLGVWAGEFLPPVPAGRAFELREGLKVVARGTVTSSDIAER